MSPPRPHLPSRELLERRDLALAPGSRSLLMTVNEPRIPMPIGAKTPLRPLRHGGDDAKPKTRRAGQSATRHRGMLYVRDSNYGWAPYAKLAIPGRSLSGSAVGTAGIAAASASTRNASRRARAV